MSDEPMSTLDRVPAGPGPSAAHRTAAVLNAAAAVFGIAWALPVLQGGAVGSDEVPYQVVILGFALSILCLVSSYAVWKRQRWGVVLTIVLNAVNFVSGVPGILFGPTAFLVVSSIVLCVVNVVVVYLLLRRGSARGAPA